MIDSRMQVPRPMAQQILADLERGIGMLLAVPAALVALSFLFSWDGHVGGAILLLALMALTVGATLLLAGTALHRRWRGRWVLQLLPATFVAGSLWLLR